MSSAAFAVRDAIYSQLSGLSGFTTKRKNGILPLQDDKQLPSLSVYFLSERKEPDGDSNAGQPHFWTDVTIGVSIVQSSTHDGLEDALDDRFVQVTDALLNHQDWLNDVEGDSIISISREINFPTVSARLATGEMRVQIIVRIWETFSPTITDALHEVRVTVVEPNNAPALERHFELAQ